MGDIPKSILARLHNESKRTGELNNSILTRYVNYRFLYRLAQSDYRESFILKGATMVPFWTGNLHRSTRDLDFLSLRDSNSNSVINAVHGVLQIPCIEDGVVFDLTTMKVDEIRDRQEYGGIRIRVNAYIGSARIRLQLDIGFGDAYVHSPSEIIIPTVIDNVPSATLMGYSIYTSISEKLEAVLTLGTANSRMKDFYDLQHFWNHLELDQEQIRAALVATMRCRKSEMTVQQMIDRIRSIEQNDGIRSRWDVYRSKSVNGDHSSDFSEVVEAILKMVSLDKGG